MSDIIDEENKDTNALQEVVNKVAINTEDCTGAAEFWKHFGIEMTPELRGAFDKFAASPSFEAQQELKLRVCQDIGYTDHEAYKDEMFKEIVDECRNVVYDLSFDKSLEATLDKEEK
jgi:hypothetical protein